MTPRRNPDATVLVGLLVLLAASTADAWGRKPPKTEEVRLSWRTLSDSESKEVLRAAPDLMPSYKAEQFNWTGVFRDYPLIEVTTPSLKRLFPAERFYNGTMIGTERPHRPYLMAVAGHTRYVMPEEFNQLLPDIGLTITRKNVIALAEAFIVLAAAGDKRTVPHITFLDRRLTDHALLEVNINGDTERWDFEYEPTKFGAIWVKNDHGITINVFNVPIRRLTEPHERVLKDAAPPQR